HLDALALDRGQALHVGVFRHAARLAEGLLERLRQIEALPALVVEVHRGEDAAPPHDAGEADGHALVAAERRDETHEGLHDLPRGLADRRADAEPGDDEFPCVVDQGGLEAGAADVDGEDAARSGSPSRTRTYNPPVNSRVLYH